MIWGLIWQKDITVFNGDIMLTQNIQIEYKQN